MSAAPQTYSAWAESLPTDEQHWACMPRGVMLTYWMVVICKALLQQKNMSIAERLRVSEMLAGCCSGLGGLAEEVVAAMQPAGPAELEIFAATAKASPVTDKDKRGDRAFDILGSARVFDLLVQANPSVLDAIKGHVGRCRAGANYTRAPEQFAPISPDVQPVISRTGYHIADVPTVIGGPASIYDAAARVWPQGDERQKFAEGSPNRNPMDPWTGR